MKHLFVINPAAGSGKSVAERIKEIETMMLWRSESYKIAVTEYPNHATEIVCEEAKASGRLRVYACGGDGTLNEVINGAAGLQNVAVTHHTTGTGNDFTKIFGAQANRFKSLNSLIDGDETVMDLYECNGRYGINIGSVGFDARIGTEVHKYSRLIKGRGAYNLSVIINVIKGIHLPYTVDVDGRKLDGRFTMLVACNGRYYGGGFMPMPEAEPDDGLLDFLLVGPTSRLSVAKIIGKFSAGRHADFPELFTHVRGKRMTIVADRMSPVNIDGERLDAQNITFSISEKKVNFFFPRDISWEKANRTQSLVI